MPKRIFSLPTDRRARRKKLVNLLCTFGQDYDAIAKSVRMTADEIRRLVETEGLLDAGRTVESSRLKKVRKRAAEERAALYGLPVGVNWDQIE